MNLYANPGCCKANQNEVNHIRCRVADITAQLESMVVGEVKIVEHQRVTRTTASDWRVNDDKEIRPSPNAAGRIYQLAGTGEGAQRNVRILRVRT